MDFKENVMCTEKVDSWRGEKRGIIKKLTDSARLGIQQG
ncbi:hypothetical protein PORCRE_1864 [Porphyromonas crevioricanis JCM 15906]|uniref:Uncharacterized protein n=1 Tax=Porphyromonas crevioricanis JCM 15906 TaxID=1305617 RepID=T1CQN2_9PORP|nr:hypothetical protein PORCRE_1864 [Porphyromonas crevioricanis JCM 15906]GAD08016.1 hypothetical protein PORCAN_1646 [Porphyromonas crevioricanis JCM 13913]